MTEDEIAQRLRRNVGQTVLVRSADGTEAYLFVLSVDIEGCTCRVSGHPYYDPKLTYWWQFDEIAEVLCEGPRPSTSAI